MKVQNLISSNGNIVPNQFKIVTKDKEIFQSYETIICEYNFIKREIILDTNALNYSKTTSKYLYLFLGMNRKQIEQDIKNGIITLKNLNL